MTLDLEAPPRRLTPDDLPHETLALARALIGKTLAHETPDGLLAVRIVETEAYPVGDRAGHAYVGRTQRNAPLFDAFGRVYVYLGYGVSWLINISAEDHGVGAGVLFRAGRVAGDVAALGICFAGVAAIGILSSLRFAGKDPG